MRRFLAAEEFRSVLALAAPIALLQTGMVLYGTVATLFAGRLGAAAIATVGLAGSTYFLLFIVALGILLGIDPLSSRAFGAGRHHECVEVLIHALTLAFLAVLPVFLLLSYSDRIFAFMGIDGRIAAGTAAYLKILRWSLFPGLFFAACRQYLQTMSITWPQLLAVILGNLVNAFLDYALIFGRMGFPECGVFGAAYAMLAANSVMFAVAAAAAAVEIRRSRWRWHGFKPVILAELLRIGFPAGMQLLAEVGAFSLVTMLCGRLGPVPAAAHQIVLNLASLSWMVPAGVSYAAAVRVGQGLGRGRPGSAARSGWSALVIGVAFMTLASAAFIFLPRRILGLYTVDAEVTAIGVRLLAVAAFFQVFDGIQVVLTGALRGLGETRIPMAANVVGYWAVGLPVGVALALRAGWGALGFWIGLCLGLCFIAVALLWVWRGRARHLVEMA
ncbi:MAG TPA: MATE family efflux transporter [Elusimicrobia bacterium]|nr:MATE family efflux transporter [Elusimicrobiota bacterium]